MATRSLNTTLAATLACAAMVLASSTAQANILINPGFDDDVRTNLGNNLGVSVTGWSTDAPDGSGFNNILVRADGSYSYGGGPDVAQSGTQYLDLHGPATPNALWQTFTLPTDSDLTFSAYYSNREANPASRIADLGIYDAAGTTPVSSLVAVDLSGDSKPSTSWTQSPIGAVSLLAGTYQVRTNMDGYMNIDSVVVDAQPSVIPEPATITVWGLLGLCWAGMSGWRRRRSSLVEVAGIESGRRRWTEEKRNAIQEMLNQHLAK